MSRTYSHAPLWVISIRENNIEHDHRNGECNIIYNLPIGGYQRYFGRKNHDDKQIRFVRPEKRKVSQSLNNIKHNWNSSHPVDDNVWEDDYNYLSNSILAEHYYYYG